MRTPDPSSQRRNSHCAQSGRFKEGRIGATLFPQYIGDVFIAFTEASCKFLKEVHAGDTLYSALEIVALTPQGDSGQVTTRATVHNQRGELVLSGEHKYLLRRHA